MARDLPLWIDYNGGAQGAPGTGPPPLDRPADAVKGGKAEPPGDPHGPVGVPPPKDLQQAVAHRPQASFEEEFQWPSLSAPEYPGPGTCYGARRMLGVLCDGTLIPCCLDGEGECPLGNLFTEELADILARPPYGEMVRGFQERRITQELPAALFAP